MTIQATFPLTLKGYALAVEDHTAITDRAAQHHYRVVVAPDHGIDEEEYEETVEAYFGFRLVVDIA
jgi:hypothetical protein